MHNSIYNTENYLEIAAGKIPRLSSFDINGRNPVVSTGTDPEDVWNYAGVQTLMTVPAPLLVSSSAAANDDDQIITLDGLDDLWNRQVVEVTPNNQTAVIVPQGNRVDTYMISLAALVAGPPADTVITQASSGASMKVVGSDTTHNTIWGYASGTFDLAGAMTDPSGTMNPAAPVPTAFTACSFWMRVNWVYNSSPVADPLKGDLYIAEQDTLAAGVPTTPARVHSKIDIGMEMTQNAHFSVPLKHQVYIMDGWGSVNNDAGYAKFGVYTRAFGKLFHNRILTSATNDGSSYINITRKLPSVIGEKSDIKISCVEVEADTTDVSAGFQIILEDLRR